MDSQNLYKYLQENLKYKRNQEILTLTRYYLFSCIFELPQKDVLFYYPQSSLFSIVGLLHFSVNEILTNELDLSLKLKQREVLNNIYNEAVKEDPESGLLNLLDSLNRLDTELNTKINQLIAGSGFKLENIISILKIETEQLLRVLKLSEEPNAIYKEFINNTNLIKESQINNSNLKFFLCNFLSNYLESINPGEFYALNNSITIAGIYSGVDIKILKEKLDYYRSILSSKEYISKKLDYIIKLDSIFHDDVKYIMKSLSNLNKKDLDFLIKFSRLIYSNSESAQIFNERKFNLITDDQAGYKILDEIRSQSILVNEITQFLTLILKYQTNFLEYFEKYNISFLHFIYENAPMLDILFSTYEGDIEVDINEGTKNALIKRIENKTRFIVDTITDFVGTPLNYEIYNLNRLNTILKKVIELRSNAQIANDEFGIILNIVNTTLKHQIINEASLDLVKLIHAEETSVEEVGLMLKEINNKVVKAYNIIIDGIYSISNSYSLMNIAKRSLATDEDISTVLELKITIENLRLIGFNNIFLADNQYFFEFNKEVFIEYLNGNNII